MGQVPKRLAALPRCMAMQLILWPKKRPALWSREESASRLAIVIPSGLFPSSRAKPIGSKTAGTPAETRARRMMSLMLACRAMRPALILHDRPWCPRQSTAAPHWQRYGAPQGAPRRRHVASRNVVSLSIVPMLGDGSAWSQRPDSHSPTASRRARSAELIDVLIKFRTNLQSGSSHCIWEDG